LHYICRCTPPIQVLPDERNRTERITKPDEKERTKRNAKQVQGERQERNVKQKNGITNKENEDKCFRPDELVELDKLGVPEPVSKEHLTEITNCIYDRYHEEIVSCAVCNQFI
jgi:hypothetical protein